MKSYLIYLTVFVLSAFTPSCKKDSALQKLDYKNVSYGNDAAKIMDVYLPANRNSTDTKVLLFIHGGSWNAGDKADFNDAIVALRDSLSNYAIFNINYRLATTAANRFPVQMEDIQGAIDFIKSKSANYNINTNLIGLVGASAGAHLALLQAYRFNTNGNIKAVVDLFGPTDLVDLYNNHPIPTASKPILVNLLGGTPTSIATLYGQASPINYVTASSTPTLIFHGGADFVVPISQSATLRTKLQSMNVPVEYIIYPTQGHGWFAPEITDTYLKATAFIKQYVK